MAPARGELEDRQAERGIPGGQTLGGCVGRTRHAGKPVAHDAVEALDVGGVRPALCRLDRRPDLREDQRRPSRLASNRHQAPSWQVIGRYALHGSPAGIRTASRALAKGEDHPHVPAADGQRDCSNAIARPNGTPAVCPGLSPSNVHRHARSVLQNRGPARASHSSERSHCFGDRPAWPTRVAPSPGPALGVGRVWNWRHPHAGLAVGMTLLDCDPSRRPVPCR